LMLFRCSTLMAARYKHAIALFRVGARHVSPSCMVRPAGRTHLEVQVLYTPGKGKC